MKASFAFIFALAVGAQATFAAEINWKKRTVGPAFTGEEQPIATPIMPCTPPKEVSSDRDAVTIESSFTYYSCAKLSSYQVEDASCDGGWTESCPATRKVEGSEKVEFRLVIKNGGFARRQKSYEARDVVGEMCHYRRAEVMKNMADLSQTPCRNIPTENALFMTEELAAE